MDTILWLLSLVLDLLVDALKAERMVARKFLRDEQIVIVLMAAKTNLR